MGNLYVKFTQSLLRNSRTVRRMSDCGDIMKCNGCSPGSLLPPEEYRI